MRPNAALAAMANPVSAHAVLREATGAAHRQLEAVHPLMSPTLTLRAYVHTLERFFDVYEALETQLEDHAPSFAAAGLDWPTRRKLPLLRRDLHALGSFRSSAAYTEHATPPRLRSFAHALGCAYVLEGATLGGVIIAKHVEAALQLGPENGASFFRAYGPAVHLRWRELCAVLESSLTSIPARDRAVDGAITTFRFFAEHLTANIAAEAHVLERPASG